ncbi:MAG: hypothetical protein KAR40_13985 [Candidatus Sabulitectum sp.]|nr:hypothetical protein [Candidatus Sabulitectum sp.]
MTEIAKESGHWYDSDGNPAYTYENAKGETKNTTLRQARVKNLFPSVTTIMKVIAAPGLERWKQNQILQAAATLPNIEGESTDDWCKRVIVDAGEHGKDAREKGTAIHGAIERHYVGQEHEFKDEVLAVTRLLSKLGIVNISTEKSFVSPLGYGGKVDFEGIDNNGNSVVIDFKTTDFKGKGKKQWPEMIMQLSAYARGVGTQGARLINIFISRNLDKPEVDFYEWSEQECVDGLRKFDLALEFWQLDKKYKPSA